jgi:dienelactone hydrolase
MWLFVVPDLRAQDPPAAPKLKDEMRQPWSRGSTDFIRQWDIAGAFPCDLFRDCLGLPAGEATATKSAPVTWTAHTSWSDFIAFDAATGAKDGAVAYALATVTRARAGKALLSVGSDDGIRVWLNGKLALTRDSNRSLTPDEDQVEVDMAAGANTLLVKAMASNSFTLRVLEPGTVLPRLSEIGPSIIEQQPEMFTVRTDISPARRDSAPVKVEVIKAGGEVLFTGTAKRGELVVVDAKGWSEGPYEARVTTRTSEGLFFVTHLPWYKGNALIKARELAAEAAKADTAKSEGIILKMLVEMVDDRLGVKLAEATGNPWPKIHSPLMEFDELMLERVGKVGRVRSNGFVRLAWRDEVDDTPQFSRAYLPSNYDASKKWPLVLQMHGFNPANPVYWRWWSADSRHALDTEFTNDQGVIYIEPHGRGNVQYMGFADSDILRGLAEAKRLFNVDEDRVYLTGDSMGGWGTWNVSTRHPELFAAIAPVFGGVDYHSTMPEEDLAKLSPIDRYFNEKQSSWSMAESLVSTPIYVHHGDMDKAVNVDWSRWGVKLLQRWGYDVRYREYPGKIHEALQANNGPMNIEWFLKYKRDPNPRKVRIRSAELRNAGAWWARVQQSASPQAFTVVDAEVVDRNVIRLDTDNVLDIVLTPGAALVDPAKPVNVIWNGVAHDLRVQGGALRLTDPAYKPARLHKTPALPGSHNMDFFVTPFAVVIGTSSKDPAMNELCREKAKNFVDAWREWQKFPPRVFLDTEITDADIARYSLMLIGGADANRVSAKLAAKLPLRLSPNAVRIDGREFKTSDAGVQLMYPHPLNAARYVWIFAGTSANGMYQTEPSPFRRYDWDYVIVDGHIPAHKQKVSPQDTRVVSGTFDYNWRFADALSRPGDAEVRKNGRQLRRADPNLKIDAKVLDSYVGRYQFDNARLLEVFREGQRFWGKVGNEESDFVAESETSFNVAKFNTRIFFERDASGKVTGITGYGTDGDFAARRLE